MRTAFLFALFALTAGSATADLRDGAAPATAAPAGTPLPLASPVSGLPMPSAAQASAMLQTFGQMREQEQQIRVQTRERMLAALSPAHRIFVATLLGQLAIAANPDEAATARAIDGALTPGERDAISRLDATASSDSAALARQMQVQIENQIPPEQRVVMQREMVQAKADFEKRLTPEQRAALQHQSMIATPFQSGSFPPGYAPQDAGSVLLRILTLPAAMPYGILPSVFVGGNGATGPLPTLVGPH